MLEGIICILVSFIDFDLNGDFVSNVELLMVFIELKFFMLLVLFCSKFNDFVDLFVFSENWGGVFDNVCDNLNGLLFLF